MSEIKWGMIGLGNVAFEFASAFKEIKNSKLQGVASKDIGRLNKFKEHFEIDKNYCFLSYEDLIKNLSKGYNKIIGMVGHLSKFDENGEIALAINN